jgi:hypothetical protein
MNYDPDWWHPTFAAISSILDVLPDEQRAAAIDRLRQMTEVYEEKGDLVSAHFCKAVSGDRPPAAPEPRPKLRLIRGGKGAAAQLSNRKRFQCLISSPLKAPATSAGRNY